MYYGRFCTEGKLRFLRALVRLAPPGCQDVMLLMYCCTKFVCIRLLPSFALLCRLLEEVSKNAECKGMIFDT